MSISDPTLGEVTIFAGTFAPRGWAYCNGQMMPIAQYTALFSLLGTTYGGDGRTTFALPDLRGRFATGAGHGPGLPDVRLGESGGQDSVTLTVQNLPAHNHAASLHAESAVGDKPSPQGKMLAGTTANVYADPNPNDNILMSSESITVANTGGNQPVNIQNPYLGVNYIIALQGIYPSRS
jgi:microcystin-dependent protein